MPKCYYSEESEDYSSYDDYSEEECCGKACNKCKKKTSCKTCNKNKKQKKETIKNNCEKCKKTDKPQKSKCSDNDSIQYVKDGQNIIITIKNC